MRIGREMERKEREIGENVKLTREREECQRDGVFIGVVLLNYP